MIRRTRGPARRHAGRLVAALLAVSLLLCLGCKGSGSGSGTVTLNGAGATFPYPLYSKWIAEYRKSNPTVRVNYQSIGSGGGIRQILAGTVDFGATDAPMSDDERKKAPANLMHVPTTIGAVVVTYNIPGVTESLKLEPDVVAAIFLGDVKRWNDPRITKQNPDAKLPDVEIRVVHRTDGSGTTAVFTSYLASVEPKWEDKVGVGKSVRWPTGLGAKGNEGVTGQLKTTPGSVGYIELAYARQNKLPVASIKNAHGEFVKPEASAISKAAAEVELPESLTATIANSKNEGAYPIASFTYILVYENAKDPTKGEALAKFLWWAIHDGQTHAAALHYAPLPESVVCKVSERLKTLKAGDRVLLAGR